MKTALFALLVVSVAPAPAEVPAGPAPAEVPTGPVPAEVWAGRQVVWGHRELPFLGRRETRTDTLVLAQVRRDATGVDLVQTACRVDLDEVAGVATRIAVQGARRLPPTRFRLERDDPGALAGRWPSGWDARDWDGDGEPGLTVRVSAPLCSGSIYLESHSQTTASATERAGVIEGQVEVEVEQRVLGVSRWCLGLGATETRERQEGAVAYVRVPDDATCDSLPPSAWPAAPRR